MNIKLNLKSTTNNIQNMESPNTFTLSQDIELHIGDATKNNISH